MDTTTAALLLQASTIIRDHEFSMQLSQNLWKVSVWYDKTSIMSDL